MKENKWQLCWKINCTPPLEVYKTFINYFGNNVDIDQLDDLIKHKQEHIDLLKEAKNEGKRVEDSNLYVKEVSVGGGRQLKRLRPAPQGRGYRIRKRSNHVHLIVDSKNDNN